MPLISDKAILMVLEQAPSPLELRQLAKELRLSPEDRPTLKTHIKHMIDKGLVFTDDKRQIRLTTHMPEVCIAKVTSYDDNGYGVIEILSQDVDPELLSRAEISLMPERKRGRVPQIGARILVRMTQYGPDQYEARVLRILPDRKERFFGRIVTFRGGLGVELADKGARRIIALTRGETDLPNIDDLIEAEWNDAKGKMDKTASIVRNFGSAQ